MRIPSTPISSFDLTQRPEDDPDDDPVVHTAVAGRADILCTLNRDFYHSVVRSYCGEHGVLIANDVEVLGLIRTWD